MPQEPALSRRIPTCQGVVELKVTGGRWKMRATPCPAPSASSHPWDNAVKPPAAGGMGEARIGKEMFVALLWRTKLGVCRKV